MFLYLRWILLKATAWPLGLAWLVPPWLMLKAYRASGGALHVTYAIEAPKKRCECLKCKVMRGEIAPHALNGQLDAE